MEFMERRNKILLVQFWLTIESFKDPLEDIDADFDAGGQESQLGSRDDEVAGTAREDLRGVWEVYFEDGVLGDDIVTTYGDDIRTFITGTGAAGMARARRR
jgi:sorting nexin-25